MSPISKSELRKGTNKILVEIWKGHGELIVVDKTGCKIRETVYKLDSTRVLPEDYDTESAFGCNGFVRARKLEEVLA